MPDDVIKIRKAQSFKNCQLNIFDIWYKARYTNAYA